MSSLGKKPSFGQPSVEFHMNTRRRASQTSSQGCCSSSSSGSNSSPTFKANTIAPATPEDFFPRQTTPEQTEMPPPKTPSPRRDITQPSVSPRQAVNSARFMTPVHASPMSSPDSSPLSSAPTDLGSSPEGFVNSTRAVKRKTRQRSPTPKTHTTKKIILSPINYGNLTPERQSYLKRKAGSSDSYVEEDDGLNACPGEWSKTPAPEKRSIWNSTFREGRTAFETKQQQRKKVSFAPSTSSSPVKTGLKLLAKPALGLTKPSSAERDEPQETNGVNERFWSSQGSNEDAAPADQPDRKPGPKKKTKDQLDLEVNVQRHEEWVEVNIFGHEDKKNPIFYAADGVTQYASPAESSPAKNGRGGANTGGGVKKRRGGGGWNKGIGRGKGKGKGRGRGNRRDEEEDPFEGKDPASDDHKTFIKAMRARQGQLRHLYKEVGRHQVDVLDTLSLRDINRLVRRANAHKKVPEYEEVLEELEDRKEDAVEFAKRQLEIERKLAEDQFAKQQELIEQRFAQHVKQTRQEHLFGAQGDIMLLEKQKAAVIDDDRTDDGSHNQDAEYFPRYHQFPESNEQARGYTSDRITDERPFKAQLSTFNYDDQVRREVLQTDIMEPVIRAIEKSNTARREAESREKTQNMMALSNEAISQLSEVKGYLVPTRMTSTELNSYSLSLLADISEYHAERFKDKAYRYLPLAPGETFPKEYLELEQLPGTRGPPRRQHPPFPRTPSVPNPRTHQFVFQNPGIPRNPPARAAPATPTARVQQRFPVQFVNQTIESRKAAGNAGKGGQRMLLPKV